MRWNYVSSVCLILGLVCPLAAEQGASQDDTIKDQTLAAIQFESGVESEAGARIDCSQTFGCEVVPYSPVCGSNGVTYANDCVFASEYCLSGHDADKIFIQAQGECASDDAFNKDESIFEPFFENAAIIQDLTVEVDLATILCSLTCKLKSDPVCGTDGVTYINDCHLLSSKCEHPDLEKASDGECEGNNLNALDVSETIYLDAAEEKCNSMCERMYEPICGSDGVTYANLCLLEYAECQNSNVKAFGPGKCPVHMQTAHSAYNLNSNNNAGESCRPEICTYIYAPVCGSDGQTHENLCLFANARCQYPEQALKIIHNGECNGETQLTCETMTCPMFTECREQVEADNSIAAFCADVCSPDRCSEPDDCQLVDSDCFTAPCSPIAMCMPKIN